MTKISICWLRRDLRLEDHTALFYALRGRYPVLPVFIFDTEILGKLEDKNDARLTFIYRKVCELKSRLNTVGSDLKTFHGNPVEVYRQITEAFDIAGVYANRDYEPYATGRDLKVEALLKQKGIPFYRFKDHVIFEYNEIVSDSNTVYKVFTPYSKKWKKKLDEFPVHILPHELGNKNWLSIGKNTIHSLEALGFQETSLPVPPISINEDLIRNYHKLRDFPAKDATSRLGIHLRFGTLSIRQVVKQAQQLNQTWLNELIWRDFYIMILAHFPYVTHRAFKKEYERIPWRHDEEGFKKWCEGKTGYPMVDAGMRQLNATGYMHNRVRMITASFLTKHLLIDWRWGEAYFAAKLLDFELASNNGGWQWAAGTGTDAQPYFRIFNPRTQAEKFDPDRHYVRTWIPEYGSDAYPSPMIDHKFARQRAIDTYKSVLGK